MAEKDVRVAVVTPVYNRREITLQCLRSLFRSDRSGIELDVFVVDDASTDGTADAIREEFPQVHLLKGTGDLWFTGGTNMGVREAMKHGPDYVLMMNDDQVFDGQFLQRLVGTAVKYPRSIVGSLLLLWGEPHRLFQIAPVWSTLRGGWQHWHKQTVWTVPNRPWEVDLIVGNCVLVPAAAIREQGLMDEIAFPNFGDAEYTPRLKRHGWRLLIEPRSRVFCQPNALPPRIRSKGIRRSFSDLLIDRRNPHSLRRRLSAYVRGGPSPLQGSLAFVFFLLRSAFRVSNEQVEVQASTTEPPLSEVFASRVVIDD